MALESDLNLNVFKFLVPSGVQQTRDFNKRLIEATEHDPEPHVVGFVEFRKLIREGKTSFPRPIFSPSAETIQIPSRDTGRVIDARVISPENNVPPKAIFMHLHPGAWVLGGADVQDAVLQKIATNASVLCISIDYRLAPEYPHPAAPNDCVDAAHWLIDNGKARFGVELAFIGGESAGANLAMLTTLSLARTFPYQLKGLIVNYGMYDLSGLPQFYNTPLKPKLLIDRTTLKYGIEAFCPGMSVEDLKHEEVSPLFADVTKVPCLPPALFTVGTSDLVSLWT